MELIKVEHQIDYNERNMLSEQDRYKLENRKKRKFVRRFLNKNLVDYDVLDDDGYDFLYK